MRRAVFLISRGLPIHRSVIRPCPVLHRCHQQPTTTQQLRLLTTDDDHQQLYNQEPPHPIVKLLSSNYSISTGEIDALIRETCPSLLDVDVDEMEGRLNNLHKFGVTYSDAVHLFRNFSDGILTLTVHEFTAQVNRIISHTMFTAADVKRLVLSAPNVFTDDFRVTTDKVTYLQYDMGRVDESLVASSGVLRHSLRHIRERHIFLSRRGLYLQVDRNKLSEEFNPEITAVFNTTDEKFCSRVAQSTIAEFETFKRLLLHEDEQYDRIVDGAEYEDEDDEDDPKNDFANDLLKYV